MIDTAALLADLKRRVRLLEDDLRARAEERDDAWAQELRAEYDRAFARERTALSWSEWRDGEVTLASVAWIVACVFVRFAEDNGLLAGARDERGIEGPWLSGPGVARDRAVENQTAFHNAVPTTNSRDWFHVAFGVLADLPAGKALLDRRHNPVWSAPISGAAADDLLAFWRRADLSGEVMHDFTDANLDTRFLGDLYQDLSDYAKKTYALLQTPVFVEEFILDRTLTPAIDEFGLEGLKLIDPTCGSGHFLLGAFARLDDAWLAHAPGLDARARVQKALDSIHGVDLNPFAVAIARFRLTVAALRASAEPTLTDAPVFGFHLAVGDSLLRSEASTQKLSMGDDEEEFTYSVEDVKEYAGILDRGQYHVVVGNPPYIQVKDKALNQRYRELFKTCSGKYALSVPFMELFFELAKRSDAAGSGAGYVGKITSNSFMKREFGKKVIEKFLSGVDPFSPVDLTGVVDTSGAYIPGHGTPTVILFGRRRRPALDTVRAALGVRGEPGQPADPAYGKVWTEIVAHIDEPGYNGTYVTISDLSRDKLAAHPWSLSGGGAGELKELLDDRGNRTLSQIADSLGITSFTLEDDVFVRPDTAWRTAGVQMTRPMVLGDQLRDWAFGGDDSALFAYDSAFRSLDLERSTPEFRCMWPYRSNLSNNIMFGGVTKVQSGLKWTEFGRLTASKLETPLSIIWAEVATHNHFVFDRGGKVFKQTAPVIKLPTGATDDEHYDLLGILNSSTACFWFKQVSHNKGSTVDTKGARQTQLPWEDFYQFNATKVGGLPLSSELPRERARRLDQLASRMQNLEPAGVIAGLAADEPVGPAIARARAEHERARSEAIFEQEELDWEVYSTYGLTTSDLAAAPTAQLKLGERAFEIELARRVGLGVESTAWFARHGSTPITELPESWSVEYREVVQRRLDEMVTNPWIRLLEQPEYKRRWGGPSWDDQLPGGLRGALLDRLGSRGVWVDANGRPGVRSVADLAAALRRDARAREVAELLVGSSDVDYVALVTDLLGSESMPHVAVQRYKPAGLEKFRAWQHVWELQRAEDRGEKVSIPVPPRYTQADFQKSTYWKVRGKLDVPKERFISYPGAALPNDDSAVFGWAGWDHAERGQALLGLASAMSAEGASSDALMPLFAGLVELEPWLRQWHADIDPTFGMSPADAITGVFEGLLAQHGVSRDDVNAWAPTPTATRRGRRPASTDKANA
ncbi:BREX-2 system adenine-specific DNA-methyltransferase PglX [Agromyces mariniharenae]|uniref:site-specific DNA-methyltransferase (adenine-specific) n=1 Tax=Agromyces mariniharenae TaxID=2604423 RepID=A0A5S4V7E1_9MICO|nr:BREX-2 system adenine-specific DNA-methyltransferase PglX [Agromyces mariniharenae]TYL54028.1 BREX-2 system adenine-specific DNA-methyltransferase PglX [Agromyces mariniharenae]